METPTSDVFQQLGEVIQQQAPALRHRALTFETPLMDEGLGLDSVGVLEVLLACEARFDIRLPAERLFDRDLTVGSLAREIDAARSAAGGPKGA
jgi:acyl carrier protein